MNCPRCQHSHFVKNGFINEKQRYKGKACNYQWTENHEKWNVKVYYADNYQAYESVLPKDKLVQDKAETHAIERNNCRMRHWFGRFKCKSIIVSKSVEMVYITVALFARFRVNGDVFGILKIGQTQPSPII